MSDRCGYLRVCLAVSLSVVSLVLFAVIGVGQTLPQGGVVEETAPQVLLSVTKGSAAGLVSVEAKNITADQVFRTVAQVMGFNIIVAKEVQSARLVAVNIKDSPLEPVLGLLAKTVDARLIREDKIWIVQRGDPAGRKIECSYRSLDVATGEVGNKAKATENDWEEDWRLPGGIRMARGRFEAQLNALLSAGRATIINEPHVITADGQPAELRFFMSADDLNAPPSSLQWPGFTCGDFGTSLWILPKIAEDGSIEVNLSLNTAWRNAAAQPDRSRQQPAPWGHPNTGDGFVTSLDLPRFSIRDGEEVMLGGFDLYNGSLTRRAAGHETMLLLRFNIRDE